MIRIIFLILALELILVDNYQFTLMDPDKSVVLLKSSTWKLTQKLHFKVKSDGNDGVIFTVANQKNYQMKLQILNKRYNLYFDDHKHIIPGLTDVKIHRNTWNEITIEEQGSNLKFKLDGATTLLPLTNRQHWSIDNWREIRMGITDENSVLKKNSIVGCIELLSVTNETILDDLAERIHAISNKCMDACAVQSCENNGKCTNHYNHAVCDCRGTGYEGVSCENEATAVHLNGSSFLSVTKEITHSISEYSIRFKTQQQDGVLLSVNKEDDYLLAELVNASVSIKSSSYTGIVYIKVGENLNDKEWHYLKLKREVNSLEANLDEKINNKSKIKYLNDHVITRNKRKVLITIGGCMDKKILSESKSKKNFIGCLQQTYVDRNDVIEKILQGNDLSYAVTGEIKSCEAF